MALFQPTNIIPSTLSGEGNGTVDVTQPLTVSWQVNGNSPMVAYRIKIMQNDTESTLKLDTGKVSLPSPFFGTDRLGNPRNYTVILSAAQLATAGIINGYANGYKLTIQQWWTADDSIEQTSASFFITRKTPELYVMIPPYWFRYQDYTFTANYYQEQGDNIEWARWELQVLSGGEWHTVGDTGVVYTSGAEIGYTQNWRVLYYTYDGFSSGESVFINGIPESTTVPYRIRCTVQTVSGVLVESEWRQFDSDYANGGDAPAALNVCNSSDANAVKISMHKNFPLLGVADGPLSYSNPNEDEPFTFYQLDLPSGTNVTWGGDGEDSLNINSANYCIFVQARITDPMNSSTFLTADYEEDSLRFSYNTSGFYISFGGITIWSADIAPANGDVFGLYINRERVYFVIKHADLTMESRNDQVIEWQNETMRSLSIFGPMSFQLLAVDSDPVVFYWVFNSVFNSERGVDYIFDDQVEFLCMFDRTLFTGPKYIGAGLTELNEDFHKKLTDRLSIYRIEKGTPLLLLIANIPLNESTKDFTLYDYGLDNQKEYAYYFLYLAQYEGAYWIRARCGPYLITPCHWDYAVLCCSQNNNGDYIVESEYRFALDVSSGNVGNNNSPALQKNFTRYPLRQPVSGNYRSGSLGAFIGKVENDQYVDTTDLMDELYNLSTNGLTKFLKTRKGQIFQIETSAPVVMQIGDKYAQQPAKITLPWVEVGDASGANILGDSGMIIDAPIFTVNPETMELTLNYNPASAMGQDSFLLTDGNLYLLDPGVYDESGFSLNSNREVILNTNSGGEG